MMIVLGFYKYKVALLSFEALIMRISVSSLIRGGSCSPPVLPFLIGLNV